MAGRAWRGGGRGAGRSAGLESETRGWCAGRSGSGRMWPDVAGCGRCARAVLPKPRPRTSRERIEPAGAFGTCHDATSTLSQRLEPGLRGRIRRDEAGSDAYQSGETVLGRPRAYNHAWTGEPRPASFDRRAWAPDLALDRRTSTGELGSKGQAPHIGCTSVRGVEGSEIRRRSASGSTALPDLGDRLREFEASVVEGASDDRTATAQVPHGPEVVHGHHAG